MKPYRPGRPRRYWVLENLFLLLSLGLLPAGGAHAKDSSAYFGIRVVDEQTGRGVPLVELETVDHRQWITDSGGWAAFHEPGLMGQRVFFLVRSHGYEFPKDGFGYAGVALKTVGGTKTTIKIKRLNIAERLYRVTGQGIYRDSVLLGEPTPLQEPLGSGKVAGQDSVSVEPFQGKLFWFWGDTWRMSYPLGHFWMAGAVSELPEKGGLDPVQGVNLRYFTDKEGFSRPMARLGVDKGVIWADGFLTLPDDSGRERLVCHYVHKASLEKMLDHGLAVFNEEKNEFERLKTLDMKDCELFPGQAHPVRFREGATDYFYLGEVFPNVRVKADWQHYIDPASYEALTCVALAGPFGMTTLLRDAEGRVRYEWRRIAKPISGAEERKLIVAGRLKNEEAHFLPRDVDSGKPILMHRGSVRWNAYRQRWIMIAVQYGGSVVSGRGLVCGGKGSHGSLAASQKDRHPRQVQFLQPGASSVFRSAGRPADLLRRHLFQHLFGQSRGHSRIRLQPDHVSTGSR